MAKKKKQPRPKNTETEETAEATEPERPTLNKTEKKALFKEYDNAVATVDEAEAEVVACKALQSEACKAIYDALGGGPFRRGDNVLYIRKRKDTYYFTGKTEPEEVQEID